MADETEGVETEEVETEDVETEETDEEEGWSRLQGMIDSSVKKGIDSWSGQNKTTSSPTRRKPAKKANPRKQGFLSRQFFSGLNPEE